MVEGARPEMDAGELREEASGLQSDEAGMVDLHPLAARGGIQEQVEWSRRGIVADEARHSRKDATPGTPCVEQVDFKGLQVREAFRQPVQVARADTGDGGEGDGLGVEGVVGEIAWEVPVKSERDVAKLGDPLQQPEGSLADVVDRQLDPLAPGEEVAQLTVLAVDGADRHARAADNGPLACLFVIGVVRRLEGRRDAVACTRTPRGSSCP